MTKKETSSLVDKIYLGEASDVLSSFPEKFVQSIVTSPEYFSNHRWKKTSLDEYLEIHRKVFKECYRVLRKDGTMFININDMFVQESNEYLNVPAKLDSVLRSMGFRMPQPPIIWLKDTAMPNSKRMQDIWEYIFVYSKSFEPKFDKEKLQVKSKYNKGRRLDLNGTATKSAPNVWAINKVFSDGRVHLKEHSCPFPPELVKNCLLLSTDENDVVLDCFSGSGTTCYVAREMDRRFIGVEVNEKYYEDSLRNLSRNSSVVKAEDRSVSQPSLFDS